MMDEASEEANLILSSVDLITIKKWLSPGKVVLFELEQFGFASALETLCGQAYGAEQYQKIGTYTYPAITHTVITKEIFPSTKEFSFFAHLSVVTFCLEWWSYEILVLLSGILPNPKLETSVLTIWYLYRNPPFCSTRVANELGAGNPEPARLSTCVVIFLAVAEAAIGSVALFCYRNVLAYLFNTDKDVVNYVSELVPLLSTAIFMDSMQSVLSGQNPIILSGLLFSLFSLS
ncbi:hypothetical protein CUMW_077650 [Citrus unshiu]|nr:hypothetical protein CUMW_077650 [Citrus unshiu]